VDFDSDADADDDVHAWVWVWVLCVCVFAAAMAPLYLQVSYMYARLPVRDPDCAALPPKFYALRSQPLRGESESLG